MPKLTINVTQEHIDKAAQLRAANPPGLYQYCPVEYALLDLNTNARPVAGYGFIWPDNTSHAAGVFVTTKKLRQFMERWDNFKKVKPGKFTVRRER